jgi:hypothetical protein
LTPGLWNGCRVAVKNYALSPKIRIIEKLGDRAKKNKKK